MIICHICQWADVTIICKYVIQWYKSVSRSKKIYSLTLISQLTYAIYIVLGIYIICYICTLYKYISRSFTITSKLKFVLINFFHLNSYMIRKKLWFPPVGKVNYPFFIWNFLSRSIKVSTLAVVKVLSDIQFILYFIIDFGLFLKQTENVKIIHTFLHKLNVSQSLF
jgi:hypothetical protein